MRIETVMRICKSLEKTPDKILTEKSLENEINKEEIFEKLESCSLKGRETALKLLSVFLRNCIA